MTSTSRRAALRRIAGLGCGALLALAVPARAQPARRRLVIDDDGFGLMHLMLLGAEGVEMLGLTTVSGDRWAGEVTARALRGLELVGRTDVPVIEGATYPLVNSEALTDRWEALYGKLTWKGAWMKAWVEPTAQSAPPYHGPDVVPDLPWGNPTTAAAPGTAADFLIRSVRRYPGEVTILATGPLTNLALAQRLDPAFAGLARELIYMGGSFAPRQVLPGRSASDFAREFANSPRREFNARFDPEAASIVSRSPWRRITVVPIDPSTATQIGAPLLDRLKRGASPAMTRLIGDHQLGTPLWDELAAAAWLDPATVRERERLFVDYDTQFGPGYGDTLSWRPSYQPGLDERLADVVRTVDVPAVEALMVRTIGAAVGAGAR